MFENVDEFLLCRLYFGILALVVGRFKNVMICLQPLLLYLVTYILPS